MSLIASTVAVIYQNGKVLLGKRTGDPLFPGWCLPGGKIEPGETPEQAIERELKEETGLTGVVTWALPDRISHSRKGVYDIKVFLMSLHDPDQIPVTSSEHSEWKWFTVSEALLDLPLAGNATRSILAEIHTGKMLYWPMLGCRPLLPDEVGRFGAIRRHEHHSGIDLYCELGTKVIAVEDGEVIAIEHFTGPLSTPSSPWWNPTQAVLVRSADHVLVYGEITASVEIGQKVKGGEIVGIVDKPVLRHFKGRPTVMMHFEKLDAAATKSCIWPLDQNCPMDLKDPKDVLMLSMGSVFSPPFDLSQYDGIKYSDPTAERRESLWWEVWGGRP